MRACAIQPARLQVCSGLHLHDPIAALPAAPLPVLTVAGPAGAAALHPGGSFHTAGAAVATTAGTARQWRRVVAPMTPPCISLRRQRSLRRRTSRPAYLSPRQGARRPAYLCLSPDSPPIPVEPRRASLVARRALGYRVDPTGAPFCANYGPFLLHTQHCCLSAVLLLVLSTAAAAEGGPGGALAAAGVGQQRGRQPWRWCHPQRRQHGFSFARSR